MTDVPTIEAIERACYPWRHTFPSMGKLATATLDRGDRLAALERLAKRDGWTDERLAEAVAQEVMKEG